VSVSKSLLEDMRDGLLETFNETAKDVGSTYKWRNMASLAGQILECEQLIGSNNMTLLSVQNKLFKEFEIARRAPDKLEFATQLSQQVIGYQKELDKIEKSAEKLLSSEQKFNLKPSALSNFPAQP